jgi:hypothetical protein
MKTKFLLLLVIIACAYSNYPRAVVAKTAETGNSLCVAGHTATTFGFWTWPANSRVTVYLREPDFSAADIAAVSLAVQNWDESALENGSNVRFNVRGLTHETKTAAGDMTLIRGDVFDNERRHLALLQAHSLKEDTLIDYVVVVVDRSVRNAAVLTNVIAHEIGHSLGLRDCYKCNKKTTAMGLMKRGGESNGIEGPTTCDKEVVVAAYRDLLARGGQAAVTARLRKALDEGEEPEADDTPVVDRP